MKIVCATDFSNAADAAEQQALKLAAALSAELIVVHVLTDAPLYREGVPWGPDLKEVYSGTRLWVETMLNRQVKAAAARRVAARAIVRTGVPDVEIAAVAEEVGADMLVVGSHGRSGLDRLLLGSVAARLARTAPCPVLMVGPGVVATSEPREAAAHAG